MERMYIDAAASICQNQRSPLLFTFNSVCSAAYSELVRIPFATLPAVYSGLNPVRLRTRSKDGTVTIGGEKWCQQNSARIFVDKLIELTELSHPVVNDASRMSFRSLKLRRAMVGKLVIASKTMRPVWQKLKSKLRPG